MKTQKLSGLVVTLLVFVASIELAYAQVTATISGKVDDASGAAVGGALVAVKNLETGAIRTVTTDETGNYRVLSLALGPQEVRAEKPGFKAAVRSGINLVVGQEAVVNLRLEVGEGAQEVDVSGEGPFVGRMTESVSGLVADRAIKDQA